MGGEGKGEGREGGGKGREGEREEGRLVFYTFIRPWLQVRHEEENFGYAGDELTWFLEDRSTVSCSNRALSVRVMCQ